MEVTIDHIEPDTNTPKKTTYLLDKSFSLVLLLTLPTHHPQQK